MLIIFWYFFLLTGTSFVSLFTVMSILSPNSTISSVSVSRSQYGVSIIRNMKVVKEKFHEKLKHKFYSKSLNFADILVPVIEQNFKYDLIASDALLSVSSQLSVPKNDLKSFSSVITWLNKSSEFTPIFDEHSSSPSRLLTCTRSPTWGSDKGTRYGMKVLRFLLIFIIN